MQDNNRRFIIKNATNIKAKPSINIKEQKIQMSDIKKKHLISVHKIEIILNN
jgi:hypothetical protein